MFHVGLIGLLGGATMAPPVTASGLSLLSNDGVPSSRMTSMP